MGSKQSKGDGRYKKNSSPSRAQIPSRTRSEPTSIAQKYNLSNFAVVTVIFNPVKYRSRYDHYQKFAEHMSRTGVQLTTVECIFESATRFGLPQQNFEITRAGDPRHIQLVAPSIIWMKENLINIAVQRLPQNIEYVAWIDADIEFDRPDWPQLTIDELQRYPIIQLFELSFFLGPGGKKDILRRDYSFGYSIRHNKPINPQRSQDWYAHPGYAWAMRRSAFTTIGGLVDFCIIGSGDLHFAFALLHRIEETLRPDLHQDYRKLAIAWGERVAQVAQNGTNVGYVPVNIWHHWHGERSDRNYVDRWMILVKNQYSPLNDLEKNDDTGLLRLADKRRFGRPELVAKIEALERDIVAYFKSRNEDNNVKTNQVQRPTPVKTKPFVSAKTQDRRGGGGGGGGRGGGLRPTGMNVPHLWTSGHSGTHVDDNHPYGNPDDDHHHHDHHHHHHHDNDPHHHDDHHHHRHHDDDHHHHHHDDDHHHHHHDDDQHHDDHHHHDDQHHDDHHHHDDQHHDDHHHNDYHHQSDYHDDYHYSGAGSFY